MKFLKIFELGNFQIVETENLSHTPLEFFIVAKNRLPRYALASALLGPSHPSLRDNDGG
jgi:hypothetical protein